MNAVPGIEVCGAAYEGVGVPACIGSGYAAAHRVLDHLDPRERMAAS
jgi:oxygen-dependent protoporphyrinogen oxidase